MTTPQETEAASLRSTAHHEAGHAVIAIMLDLSVEEVSIKPEADTLGHCTKPSLLMYMARHCRSVAREYMICYYAGIPAQRLVDGEPADFHGDHDEDQVWWIAQKFAIMPRHCSRMFDDYHLAYLERLRRKAEQLVKRYELAIRLVAGELLVSTTLSGKQVEQILRQGGHLPMEGRPDLAA